MTRLAARTLCALAASLVAAGALAAAPAARPASIPFANHDGIKDWRTDGTKGLWVQDRGNQWYYAAFMGPCTGVNFAETLAFRTEPDGSLNQHSAILFKDASIHDQQCPFRTFERSAPPPLKAGKKPPVQKPAPASK